MGRVVAPDFPVCVPGTGGFFGGLFKGGEEVCGREVRFDVGCVFLIGDVACFGEFYATRGYVPAHGTTCIFSDAGAGGYGAEWGLFLVGGEDWGDAEDSEGFEEGGESGDCDCLVVFHESVACGRFREGWDLVV